MSDLLATWDDVLKISSASPEIAAIVDIPTQDFFLAFSAKMFTEKIFGSVTLEIQSYAAAHIAQMSATDSAGSGPPSTEVIGGISSTKTLPVLNTNETWGETIYGRMVKKIKTMFGPPTIIVGLEV